MGGGVARMGRHEVRELERDQLFRLATCGLNFEAQIAPIRGRELDWHVTIEGFNI